LPAKSSRCSVVILKPFSDFETCRRGTPSIRAVTTFFTASISRGVRSHLGSASDPVFDVRAAIDSPLADLANLQGQMDSQLASPKMARFREVFILCVGLISQKTRAGSRSPLIVRMHPLIAGTAPSVVAPVGSGCRIVGPIVRAVV
jgi:hypothetical protein